MPSEPLAPAASPRDDRINERPLTVWIPTSLHRKLKVVTAKRGITMKEYVLRKLLAEELDEP
jgi:hypothetical protein